MVREVAADEFARVLHDEDRRAKRGHELARPLDQTVTPVVPLVVLAVHSAEPRAGCAGDQHVELAALDPRLMHELLGRVDREVGLARREANVGLVRGVALQRPHPAARLADLCIDREDRAKRGVALEAEAHASRAGEQVPESERCLAIHRFVTFACMHHDLIRCGSARTSRAGSTRFRRLVFLHLRRAH